MIIVDEGAPRGTKVASGQTGFIIEANETFAMSEDCIGCRASSDNDPVDAIIN